MAVLAGADAGLALRIGAAMSLLQLGIGTLNDVVDAPADAGLKPGKPIPAGLVDPVAARAAAVACFVAGTALAASAALVLVPLAVLVIGIGLAYDLRLKGTAWSWLPFAVGIPILPVFGWLGATGTLPSAFVVLVPAAVAAGAALAIGNSLVDVERDLAAGRSSVAATLGPRRAGAVASGLFGAVAAAAVLTAWLAGAAPVAMAGVLVTGIVVVVASVLARTAGPDRREWAWRIEAAASGVLAILWLAAVPVT